MNYQDKGNYFRGLLILIGKDNIIHEKEKKEILKIGKKLGFEEKFCIEAVNEFLENRHIQLQPPVFSSEEIAINFLEDAIDLSLVDNDFHIGELEWLQKIAFENGLEKNMVDNKLKDILVNSNFNKREKTNTLEIN